VENVHELLEQIFSIAAANGPRILFTEDAFPMLSDNKFRNSGENLWNKVTAQRVYRKLLRELSQSYLQKCQLVLGTNWRKLPFQED
jgi:hypothetical protein